MKKRRRPWPNRANAARTESIFQAAEIEQNLKQALAAINRHNYDLARAYIALARKAAQIIALELEHAPGDPPAEEPGQAEPADEDTP